MPAAPVPCSWPTSWPTVSCLSIGWRSSWKAIFALTTARLADPTDLEFSEDHLDAPDALAAALDDVLARKPHLATRRPTGEIGQGASPLAASSVDLAALLRQRAPLGGNMADLRELADQAAEELLKGIRDQARKAGDTELLRLAQAYSMVVSTEVSTRLADEGATAAAEFESGFEASISSISPAPE